MINDAAVSWIKRRTKQFNSENEIAACCGAHVGIYHSPVGLNIILSKPPTIDGIDFNNPPSGFKLWQDSLFFEELGMYLKLLGVSSIPGMESQRTLTTGTERYVKGFEKEQNASRPEVVSIVLNNMYYPVLSNRINADKFDDPFIRVRDEEWTDSFKEALKGKYVISIEVDSHLSAQAKLLGILKPFEIYRSPKFQNRRYNAETDYLCCVLYKF